MQTFCKLIGYRAGLSLGLEVSGVQIVAGQSSCSGLGNNLLFCQRIQGATRTVTLNFLWKFQAQPLMTALREHVTCNLS